MVRYSLLPSNRKLKKNIHMTAIFLLYIQQNMFSTKVSYFSKVYNENPTLSGALTSQVRAFAMLLRVMENYKVWRWSGFQWNNSHIMFHESSELARKLRRGKHTQRHTQIAQ
jgi:hypothetical protein